MRVLVVALVLGLGTALTFAVALATAVAFPGGTLVPNSGVSVLARPMIEPAVPVQRLDATWRTTVGIGPTIDDPVVTPGG